MVTAREAPARGTHQAAILDDPDQLQHEEIMELGLIQHKYYEIRRAANIDALC